MCGNMWLKKEKRQGMIIVKDEKDEKFWGVKVMDKSSTWPFQ